MFMLLRVGILMWAVACTPENEKYQDTSRGENPLVQHLEVSFSTLNFNVKKDWPE